MNGRKAVQKMVIKFYELEENEEIAHLVNTNHIVSVDIFPDDSMKIVLDNGTVYERKNYWISMHDWERLQKLNIGGEE